MIFHEKNFEEKNLVPWDPLGYLGSLSWDQLVEFFQNSMGLVLLGLEVTPITVSALENFRPLRGHSFPMCCVS